MRSLLYMYDPLCGWCYAATPGIARLRAAGIAVDLLPTGLFCDPGKTLTADFADYACRNDQRIAGMTGQVFTEAYRRRVLGRTGSAFDSTAATLALTAVAMHAPDREADALRVVQEARYMLGRDITDLAALGATLEEAGFTGAVRQRRSRGEGRRRRARARRARRADIGPDRRRVAPPPRRSAAPRPARSAARAFPARNGRGVTGPRRSIAVRPSPPGRRSPPSP